MPRALHKPGAMPLRPLGLGDIYDAAFKVIRYNPRATVGGALVVGLVSLLLPVAAAVVVNLVLGSSLDLGDRADPYSTTGTGSTSGLDSGDVGTLVFLGVTLAGSLLLQVGLVLVTGMVASVTHSAAIGRTVGLEEAWTATRGRRWRLLGLALLTLVVEVGIWVIAATLVVVAFVTAGVGLGVIALLVLGGLAVVLEVGLWVRLVPLSTAALVIERLGVGGALARAFALSRGSFWRLLGITALTALLTAVVSGIVGVPFNALGQVGALVGGDGALIWLVLFTSLGSVLRSAFISPFTAAVHTLLYLDRRMRSEAYDVDLLAQSGLLDP